jgi:hypothetical protein
MTKRIQKTPADLLELLQKTVTALFDTHEQLSSHSSYWILFERKTRDTYGLSFWPKVTDVRTSRSKVEISLTSVVDYVWLECEATRLSDLSDRIFEVPRQPKMTFNLTFAVVNRKGSARVVLKHVRPGTFADYFSAVEPQHDPRSASA